jgi:hypothetical protein
MTRFHRALFSVVIVLLAAVSASGGGTDIVKRWTITGLPVPTLSKILVIGLTENYIVRQYFEDEMEKQLKKNGAVGIKGHMVLPPRDEMTLEEIRKRIHASPLDAVLIARPMGIRKEEEYIPPSVTYVPPYPYYYGFGPYWNYAYTAVYSPGWRSTSTARTTKNSCGAG